MSAPKSHIRKEVLRYRRLMSVAVYQERNNTIIDLTLDLLVKTKIGSVHIFLPIQKNKEVNTWQLLTPLTELGNKVLVSATDFEAQTMSHFLYSADLVFENDRFGIPTPSNGQTADLRHVEAVIIPMLAADKLGNRIGYGKGYYDRLLAEMNSEVLKIGLLLGPLFDHFSFAEPHDIALDYCVTPKGVIKF